MMLNQEQIDDIKEAAGDALNKMLLEFVGSDPMSKLTSSIEATIGHADFADGRTGKITIMVEIVEGDCDDDRPR